MQNKAFSKIEILIILIFLIVAGGYFGWYYLSEQKEETKAPEQTTRDETADWQTYRNEEYGFEIKYPTDWYVGEYVKIAKGVGFATVLPERMLAINAVTGIDPNTNSEVGFISIEIDKGYLSIDDWFDEGLAIGLIFSKEETSVGSEKAYKTSILGRDHIVLHNKENIFLFFQTFPIDCQALNCSIFNQMLSTFRFLD